MTEFALVRHGETDWNKMDRLQGANDIPLNTHGIAQAKIIGAHLAQSRWDVVISSPLGRAHQTATHIATALNLDASDIVVDHRLHERSYGDAEGKTLAERRALWPDDTWPNAETRAMIDARTGPTMEDLAQLHTSKRVVLVGHGSWIRSALRVVTNYDPEVMRIRIPNASFTLVQFDGHQWRLRELAFSPGANTSSSR